LFPTTPRSRLSRPAVTTHKSIAPIPRWRCITARLSCQRDRESPAIKRRSKFASSSSSAGFWVVCATGVELGKLLPFLCIVEKPADKVQFRLMGSAMARDLGCDLTGKALYVYAGNPPETIAAAQALGERVFANAQPVFREFSSGIWWSISWKG
jgi:hypothetical protein